VHTHGALALVDAWAGRLDSAEALATRAVAIAREAGLVTHAATGDALLALGMVARERGEVGRSDHLLDEGGARAALNRRFMLQAVHRAELALLHLAAGRPVDGLRVLADEPPGAPPLPPG